MNFRRRIMKNPGEQINLYFDKVYGTGKESLEKFKNICIRFDDLFPNFFFVAYESYSKKEFEDFPQSKDLLYHTEHNLFHILKRHFFDCFNACTLNELCDFLKVFKLLNSPQNIFTHPLGNDANNNREFKRSHVLADFECESYCNYKNTGLSFFIPYLQYDSIEVCQPLNREIKINLGLVWHTLHEKTFPKKQRSLPVLLQSTPLEFWDYKEIKKDVSKIVTEDNLTAVNDKDSFEFLLWYTYKILTFNDNEIFADGYAGNIIYDNGSELESLFGAEEGEHSKFLLDDIFGCCADENFEVEDDKSKRTKETSVGLINASEEERKKYAQKCSDCIMRFLKNAPALLDKESAFKMFFILFNAYYFEKSKNNLLNLLTFGYIYLYMILNDTDAFENIPDKPKKTCFNWRIEDSKSVYEIISNICILIDEYLLGIREKNKKYNIKIDPCISSIEFPKELTVDDMFFDVFPQVKRFFEKSGKKHVTYADDCRAETATILTEQLGYRRKDLVEFLSDYKSRRIQQEEIKLLYNELTKLIPVISILNNLNLALVFIPNYHQDINIKRILNVTDEFFFNDEIEGVLYTEIFDDMSFKEYISTEIVKHYKQENQVLKEINSKFGRLLKEDLPIDKIMELKQAWSKDIRSSGLDRETILNNEEILCRIVSLIEDKASKSEGYEELYKKTVNNLSVNLSKIKKLLQSVYSDKEFDDEIFKFFKSLSTGEYLYKAHILSAEPTTEREHFDYSCVALQYYTALEHLINFLFYYPYKEQVLNNVLKEGKNLENYIGGSSRSYIFRNGGLKDSVELGTFSHIFSCSQKEPPCNYIAKKMLIDPKRLSNISMDILKISKPRNDAAHGGNIVTKESAVEARQNVYEKSAEIASRCRELIPQIFGLFDTQNI